LNFFFFDFSRIFEPLDFLVTLPPRDQKLGVRERDLQRRSSA